MNFYIFEQFAVIPPSAYTDEQVEWVAGRVLELCYTAWDLRAFAEDLGYEGPPFVWEPERRAQLRAQLDALYLHLYGVDREQAGYLLDTFPIVRRHDQQEYGRYRTKELILAYYDDQAAGRLDTWHGPEELRQARRHDGG